MNFNDLDLLDQLDQATREQLDQLPFGVVRMNTSCAVVDYNTYESALSGLSPDRVVGKHFFEEVALCTNNYMVSERFTEHSLDHQLDYIFTFRMKPTKVRLRLLKSPTSEYQYLLVQKN